MILREGALFDDLIRGIERLSNEGVDVPVQTDEKGYIDKQCPAENCEFIFKVNKEDWSQIFKDEAVWCPMCRYEAPADQWFTIAQAEHARSEALQVVKGTIHNALREGAQKFNRRQPRGGFVSISMKVTGGPQRTQTVPAKAATLMQLEIQCEECLSRFAVIGSAYFCPACGHNSVNRTFSDSLRKIRVKKENVELVRKALCEGVGIDDAVVTCRSLIETCISDGVVAFQKYCEGMYAQFGESPFNAFQRLDQANELWKNVLKRGFENWISDDELKSLEVLYQKRHLLAHNEGIVDDRYVMKTGDASYKPGQRIIIAEKDIDFILRCFEKLSEGIKQACNDN
tara:strand:- start:29550 stop:30575 length:1026 start_codon:yes stop_codon:yes gene_type:complete